MLGDYAQQAVTHSKKMNDLNLILITFHNEHLSQTQRKMNRDKSKIYRILQFA